MKGADKQKKLAKKPAQKSLKEKRAGQARRQEAQRLTIGATIHVPCGSGSTDGRASSACWPPACWPRSRSSAPGAAAAAPPTLRPSPLQQPAFFGRAPGSARPPPRGRIALRHHRRPRVLPGRRPARPDRPGAGHDLAARRGRSRAQDAARRDLPDRRRAGAGLRARVRARRRQRRPAIYRYLFPGYTLVAYDDRGTGESGLLDCPAVQAALTADQQRAAAAACAGTIGPQRAFYSTAEHAEDLDAVRQALGLDKIGLYGVSYGTKLAMAYALAHPTTSSACCSTRCCPPELPDPYSANVLRDLPATLSAFCADGSCQAATGNFAATSRGREPAGRQAGAGQGARGERQDGLEANRRR